MTAKEKVRLGMSGLGSFSVVIANTIQRSKKVELVTCFDVAPERRKASCDRYGCLDNRPSGLIPGEIVTRAWSESMRHDGDLAIVMLHVPER